MVEFSQEDLAFLAAAVLAQAYITPRLPDLPEGGLISFLNDPTTQSFLVIGVVFLALHSVWNFIRDLLSKDEESGGSVGVEVFTGPPSTPLYVAAIRFGGVDWDAQFGLNRGSEISYVDGPYCPRCETELSMKTKNHRIRQNQKLWKCHSCDFSTSRETNTKDTQRDVVEKIVENEANDAIRNLFAWDEPDIQEVLEDIFNEAVENESKVEDFLDDPSPDKHDPDIREAIHQAIDEVVGEEQIRRDPTLRVVLRKGLGYSLPGDDRNYDILDEEVAEDKVRRRSRW
jgi:transposase-like protein